MNKPLAVLTILLVVAPFLSAQQAPAPGEPERKQLAHLRAWIVNPPTSVAIQAKLPGSEEVIGLASSSAGAASLDPSYTQLAPGRVAISLLEAESDVAGREAPEVRVNESLALRDGGVYTLIAWISDKQWQVKVFADKPADESSPRSLRALNFADGREAAVAASGGSELKLAADSLGELKVPPRMSDVHVKVLASDGGSPTQSIVEVDFASVPSAYVVIRPDYRGRMRPRVILGGGVDETAGSISEGSVGEE